MSAIVFYPAFQGPGDGYKVFQPEALAWAKAHDAACVEITAHKMTGTVPRSEKAAETNLRLAQVLKWIDKLDTPITDVCFCCHGWRTGNQMGLTVDNARAFVERLAPKAHDHIRIWMQSCTCGGGPLDKKWTPAKNETGDRGLADTVRDSLCIAGRPYNRVDAHATAGHATQNPYVRRFDGQGNPLGGRGGVWIISPDSPLWRKWQRALKDPHDSLRYRFTEMDLSDIEFELSLRP